MANWGRLGVWGWGVWEPGVGVGVRLCAGEGEFWWTGGQWGRLIDCVGVDAGGTPLMLLGPREPTEDPLPAPPADPGWAKGLPTGKDDKVGICPC